MWEKGAYVAKVGVCGEGGMHGKGCVHGKGEGIHAGETATEAGGTHPTGMHSCFITFFKICLGEIVGQVTPHF